MDKDIIDHINERIDLNWFGLSPDVIILDSFIHRQIGKTEWRFLDYASGYSDIAAIQERISQAFYNEVGIHVT